MEPSVDLLTALCEAQAEFPAVAKARTAEGEKFSYQYADLADVNKAITPVLNKHGLAISHLPSFEGEMAFMRSRLYHKDGTYLEAVLPLVTTRQGPQALGSSITYMKRYNIGCLCNLVLEEDDDGNGAENRDGKTRSQSARKPAPITDKPGTSEENPYRATVVYDAENPCPELEYTRHKGTPICEIDRSFFDWLIQKEEEIPEDSQYHQRAVKRLKAYRAELDRRVKSDAWEAEHGEVPF